MADFGKFIEDVHTLAGQAQSGRHRDSFPIYLSCPFCSDKSRPKARFADSMYIMYECSFKHQFYLNESDYE